MNEWKKQFIEIYFRRVGLEAQHQSGGSEHIIRVGNKDQAPRDFQLDPQLLNRQGQEVALVARLDEIIVHYNAVTVVK